VIGCPFLVKGEDHSHAVAAIERFGARSTRPLIEDLIGSIFSEDASVAKKKKAAKPAKKAAKKKKK
jgi:hypothetical protein